VLAMAAWELARASSALLRATSDSNLPRRKDQMQQDNQQGVG
jgi:hypothetical protein